LTLLETATVELPDDAQRRLAALARWRKRSRLVRFYRRALPFAMMLLLLFGIGWVAVRAVMAAYLAPKETAATIHLLHPRFYGRNEKNQPYVLSASEAVRDGAEPNRIGLTSPVMEQAVGAPSPQVVSSDRGAYNEQGRLLDLFGHVKASDGQGNHFFSETARVDMPRNMVSGRTAVSGYGPQGTFSASSYVIYDKGDRVVLNGNVHAHLLNHPSQETSRPVSQPKEGKAQ
jgi:lipopolysaccharide export system protein LptC